MAPKAPACLAQRQLSLEAICVVLSELTTNIHRETAENFIFLKTTVSSQHFIDKKYI